MQRMMSLPCRVILSPLASSSVAGWHRSGDQRQSQAHYLVIGGFGLRQSQHLEFQSTPALFPLSSNPMIL